MRYRDSETGWAGPAGFVDRISDVRASVPGLAAFVVHESGLGDLAAYRDILAQLGFDVLHESSLDARCRSVMAERLQRAHPDGADGLGADPPRRLLAVHDVYPDRRSRPRGDAAGASDNARVLRAQWKMRLHTHRAGSDGGVAVSASADADQAVAWLSLLAPVRVESVLELARRRNDAFRTPYPVLADLSKHACRAKVELIDFHGRRAICKTFRPGRERFLAREVKARELGASLPEVSRLLEVGPCHLVVEWYADSLPRILAPRPFFFRHGLLPLWVIERLRAVILHYRRLGYECIDLSPCNLLYDPYQGLRIIDFEFLQPGPEVADTLEGNYAWYPVPRDFSGDVPPRARRRPYWDRWFFYTGLPRRMCLYELPRPLLTLTRSLALVPLTLAGLQRVGWNAVRRLGRGL
ncbi:hypothetical protein HNO53_00780 [Billgrantia antri]|uniref:Serine/threonine protein kinase n=1 Tax=Halomonas sulfidivorans TaxID=2733488 RepID=A0ABX7WAI7_9GAMM|nr:hypothetical protein [Halomonas sulfidivorans]QTP57381.1 hypothetical protein HNO53_00780 [Halomonas sulfidivorans]